MCKKPLVVLAAAFAATVVFAVAVPALAGYVPISGNLIVNPGAESGMSGWTNEGAAWDAYSSNPIGVTPSHKPPGGLNNFFWGRYDTYTDIWQTINVSAYTTQINTGELYFDFSGWLGGWGNQADYAWVRAGFNDSSGNRLDTAQIGPVTNGMRGNETKFMFQEATGLVPVGTKSVDLAIHFYKAAGSASDGLVDVLDLQFERPTRTPVHSPRNAPDYWAWSSRWLERPMANLPSSLPARSPKSGAPSRSAIESRSSRHDALNPTPTRWPSTTATRAKATS